MDWRIDHLTNICGPLNKADHLANEQAFKKPTKEISIKILKICRLAAINLESFITELEDEIK